MRPSLAGLLSFNGGYVDTIGFLALAGLFTAHVTGNFVTIGAALAFGTTGVLAKLLALPVFCLSVLGIRLFMTWLKQEHRNAIWILLSIMLAMFTLVAILALSHGPFHNGDAPEAIGIGMLMVVAMAIQNALHRVHLSKLPPTTLMTGTTTQIMIDLADLLSGMPDAEAHETRVRLARMVATLLAFALGCTAGAFAFILAGAWCFVVPPIVLVACFVAHAIDG